MTLNRAFVFRGEGIECEEELFRALCHFKHKEFSRIDFWNLPAFRKNSKSFYEVLNPGDWVFLPGGFSFSDHFGSGRLLADLLNQTDFAQNLLAKKAHALGICNGFQTLVSLGVFGSGVQLLSNSPRGFVDKWVGLKTVGPNEIEEKFRFAVRHGEGRLVGLSKLDSLSKVFLKYDDEIFTNGSEEAAAGVVKIFENGSHVWGLMPHPEVAMRKRDDPAFRGPQFNLKSQNEVWAEPGDGLRFFEKLFTKTKGNS